MNDPKRLTFEIDSDGHEIQIHCNKEGIDDLIRYLQKILNSKTLAGNHNHWMTPSWAGDELTEEKYNDKNKLINKVSVYLHQK